MVRTAECSSYHYFRNLKFKTGDMRPLIFDYVIEREGDIDPSFQYDPHQSLNVITIGNNKKAFIEAGIDDLSFLTNTRIQKESDDTTKDILELQTKTKVIQERDDDENSFLEFGLKTFVKRERDDEGFNNF